MIKKIALTAVAALSLATVSFAPANAAVATTLTIAGTATGTDGLTSANAVVLPVPSDNSVDSTDVVRIAVTGIATGTDVTATATDAVLVPAVATVAAPVTASAGSATAKVSTGTGTTADFYVFTKTTKVGTVVVTVGTATPVTYYVKGTAAALNTIKVDAPTAALGTTAKVTATGTDVFGNAVSGSVVALQVVSGTATNTYSITTGTDGIATKELTGLAVGSYDLIATATVATAVTGLTAPTGFVRGTLKVVDLAALVATKDAELALANATIADLKAQLVALKAAEIAKYNALANLYNKTAKKKVTLRK